MPRNSAISVPTSLACALLGVTMACASAADSPAGLVVAVTPASLPRIATVDSRYQSYNVEMAEVIGGNFWKPYDAASIATMKAKAAASAKGTPSAGVAGEDPTMFQKRSPIDLANPRLRKLAAALGPAYMRTSGTWASTVYFDDKDGAAPATAPKGFQGVLTRSEWRNVIDFAQAVDARLVTSFAISAGVRDAKGVWMPDQARLFLAASDGHIAAAEFFNEPDMPTYGGGPAGYTAADYARDFAVFRKFAKKAAPDMQIVGPGSVGEAVLMPRMSGGLNVGVVRTQDMLSATPRPVFDIFSYHFYGAASLRCAAMGTGAQTTPEAALSEEWLSRTDTSYTFYVKGLRDHYAPGKPVWITETADAACGGNPWAATFLDSFRYLDQMGRLAKQGVKVIFHNTLASSEYGLLEQGSFTPRPNYWAALLWHQLMGTTVLDAGPSKPGLHLYAQCLPGHAGGVTLLAINNSRSQSASVELPLSAQRYTLSAARLEDSHVRLNGHELLLGGDDTLPSLQGTPVPAGSTSLAPVTITFLAMADAENPSCR
ncbi:hypothetical protein [Rhodanobacter umsongensis]